MSFSNAASSAQTLLDALLELRRLGLAGVFSDSERFQAAMLELRPGLKKEVRVLSALIDAGYLQRLQDADAGELVIAAAQLSHWLEEELMLSSAKARYFSDVLLAFFGGEANGSAAGSPSAQSAAGAGVPSVSFSQTAASAHSPGDFVFSADECIGKGMRLYAKGQYREAADWCRRAAEQGDADAQYLLGNLYRDGVGVESDWDQALDLYRRAAAQGHAEAKEALILHIASNPAPNPIPKQVPQSAPQPSAPSPCGVYADKRVGDRFEFGRWPQGRYGEVRPVVWRVLLREADHLLVIAEKGLDCKQYHDTYTDITWADCSLRRWLNADFYSRAFNGQERALILPARLADAAGPAADDRVFLLSLDEAETLFASDSSRQAVPTDFAVKNGAYTSDSYKIGGAGCCWWWLRSRGCSSGNAANVGSDGGVYDLGNYVSIEVGAVRPVLKIAL